MLAWNVIWPVFGASLDFEDGIGERWRNGQTWIDGNLGQIGWKEANGIPKDTPVTYNVDYIFWRLGTRNLKYDDEIPYEVSKNIWRKELKEKGIDFDAIEDKDTAYDLWRLGNRNRWIMSNRDKLRGPGLPLPELPQNEQQYNQRIEYWQKIAADTTQSEAKRRNAEELARFYTSWRDRPASGITRPPGQVAAQASCPSQKSLQELNTRIVELENWKKNIESLTCAENSRTDTDTRQRNPIPFGPHFDGIYDPNDDTYLPGGSRSGER